MHLVINTESRVCLLKRICAAMGATTLRLALTLAFTFGGGAVAAQSDTCAGLESESFSQTRIVSSQWVAANTDAATPAFCEVQGNISPVQNSNIGVVYRLPENWNGKMVGLGGGGWAGNVRLSSAAAGLNGGYATAQTDAGTGEYE